MPVDFALAPAWLQARIKPAANEFTPVDFRDILDAMGRVKTVCPLELYAGPDNDARDRWAKLLTLKNLTAFRVKEAYKGMVCREYTEILKKRGKGPNWEIAMTPDAREASEADFMRAFCAGFKVVFGHTFVSASRFLKGKAINAVGQKNFYAISYLKKLGTKEWKLGNEEAVAFALQENKAMALLAMSCKMEIEDRNYQQKLKLLLKDTWGFSDADWRFLCQQSQSYIIRGIRYHILRFAVKNRLKDAHMRNHFIKKAKSFSPVMNRALQTELRRYQGPMNKFSPFKVEKRGAGRFAIYQCRELDMIKDFLHYNPVVGATTFAGLLRLAEVWHREEAVRREEEYERRRRELANLPPPHNGPFNFKGVKDEYVVGTTRFELVQDSDAIYKEGSEMHHCVGGYNQRCGDHKYIVFRVFGEERATLGCSMEDGVLQFNQLYGYCNEYVSEAMHNAARTLISQVNADVRKWQEEQSNKLEELVA